MGAVGCLVVLLAVVGCQAQNQLVGSIIQNTADLSRLRAFLQFGQTVNGNLSPTDPTQQRPINTNINAPAFVDYAGPVADIRKDLFDFVNGNQGNIRTIFAPTNAAFDRLGVGTETDIQRGLENNDPTYVNMARAILGYHLTAGTVNNLGLQNIIQSGGFVSTFTGTYSNRDYDLRISSKNGRFYVNDAMIGNFNQASNGGVWLIDTLLTPPQCGFTNIAPEGFVWTSKDMFPGVKRRINDGNDNTVWKNYLPRYHQNGNTMEVQLQFKRAVDVCQVQILWAAQMPATRVRVYTIDIDGQVTAFQLTNTVPGDYSSLEFPSKDTFRVGIQLDPVANANTGIFDPQPRFMAIAEVYIYEEAASEGFSVYDVVAYDQTRYSWLSAALHITNLWKVLKEESNYVYTLFAPTDAAFRKLPPAVLETITMYETPTLADILFYHVVPNNNNNALTRNAINGMEHINTLGGFDLEVARGGNWINNAELSTQHEAVNGIVIPIDNVFIPPNIDVAAEGSIRLSGNGPSSLGMPTAGRIEIYRQGTWGTICDNGILDSNRDRVRLGGINNVIDPNIERVSNVICRELGYIGGNFLTRGTNVPSAPSGMPIHYSNPQCANNVGTLTQLIQCNLNGAPNLGNGINECNSGDNLGIQCSVEGEVFLSQGDTPWTGVVNIRTQNNNINNQFAAATVCPLQWGNEEASVVCRQLGFHGGVATTVRRTNNIQLPSVTFDPPNNVANGCVGNEKFLHECSGRRRLIDIIFQSQNNCYQGGNSNNNNDQVAFVTCTPFAELLSQSKTKKSKLSVAEIQDKVRSATNKSA